MKYKLRDAVPGDCETIATFNSRMAEETEGRALNPDIIGPGVARLLENVSKDPYWVAESDGQIVGQIMGVWFLAASIGSYIGGEIASLFESLPLPELFGTVAAVNIGVAVLVIAAAPLVKKQMGGVR